METLLIRIYPGAAGDEAIFAEWIAVDANRLPIGEVGYGALEEAAQAAHYKRAVVLVPTEHVLLTRVDIKARNREQLARALPYALEEDLAEDVEQLHFAPGPRQPDGSHPVAVAARGHMTRWLAQLEAAGLVAHALIPDALALPVASDNGWSLLLEKDRALLRTGPFSGFTLELANLESLLNCMLEDTAVQPPMIEVYGCNGEAGPPLPPIPSVSYELREGCPPPLWVTGLEEKRSINLLQGDYRTKSDIVRLIKPWRAAAVLFGVWIALQAVDAITDYQRLAADERALQADITRIYKDTFPNADRIVNARVQMEQQLAALQEAAEIDSGETFMLLLDAAGKSIQDLAGVSIETLDYLNGRLELSLSARELASFEALRRKIEDHQGLAAEIQSAETRGATVSGRLVIRETQG